MIKTKYVFLVFFVLALIVFPYYIIYLSSDFVSSIVPGWNTTIVSGQIISNLIKFVALLITTICYWKLSKINNQIILKSFLIHFTLTIPAVFISRMSLYELITSISFNPENFVNRISLIIFINICLNILFCIGQIIFWRFYIKSKRSYRINKLT
ncbi:DUF2569 domain-containing protein [Flavobacterium chungbukense]|uniref:DUF4293 family protein n=1 Tax=Flavobacterium chungbukense TaxID=877464 RepID=A0ABP7XPV0_9FLAO